MVLKHLVQNKKKIKIFGTILKNGTIFLVHNKLMVLFFVPKGLPLCLGTIIFGTNDL